MNNDTTIFSPHHQQLYQQNNDTTINYTGEKINKAI